MFIFKTSGATFESVIENQKHAFVNQPKDWAPGEIILVSKNKKDLTPGEKQIRYIMRFDDTRKLKPGEAEKYWPGNEGRWNYLIVCKDTKPIKPFNLGMVIGPNAENLYSPVVTYAKLKESHAQKIEEELKRQGVI